MSFFKKEKETVKQNEQARQFQFNNRRNIGSKIRNTFLLIAAIIGLIVAIPDLTAMFGHLELSKETQRLYFLLGMFIIYVLVVIVATAKQDTIDFIPTTATRYRFLFALFLIFYVYFFSENFNNLTELRILILLFISYCSLLSIWILKASYAKYRRTRTIIDIVFTSLFIAFCGDPHLVFFVSLLIPVTVISRHFSFKEMPLWIGISIGSYMFATFLHLKLFNSISYVRGLNYELEFNQLNFIEYASILYFEVLFIILISLIYWSERKRENKQYSLISEISSVDSQLRSIPRIIHILCSYLKIQIGLVIQSDQNYMSILGGYSLYRKAEIIPQSKIDISNYNYLLSIFEKTTKHLAFDTGYDSQLKSEIINNELLIEDFLLDTEDVSYLCINIYKNTNKFLHLLFLNKVTPNEKIVREFSDKDIDIIKSISPKILKIVNP